MRATNVAQNGILCDNDNMHKKTFAYRLYPTKAQVTAMERTLDECRWLYNHLLEERKTAWESAQRSVSLYDQHGALPALKAERESLVAVHSQVLQNVAVRLDLAFQAFFRRVKAGEQEPGFPRFRGRNRYDSFCYPQSGFALLSDRVRLSKIGAVRVVKHRPLEGKAKTCCIRRSATGKWYVTIVCAVEDVPLPPCPDAVGVDVGLTTFATFSNGETVANPRFFRTDEPALTRAQRNKDNLPKGTKERRKKARVVCRVHERIAFRRHDFTHQTARRIVNRYGFIAVEDLAINTMVENHHLAKSMLDASWGMFANVLFEKAEGAARTVVRVNPAYTSQDCSQCHARQVMPLAQRIYRCSECGLILGRDVNAARNILAVGMHSMGEVP